MTACNAAFDDNKFKPKRGKPKPALEKKNIHENSKVRKRQSEDEI
jgi:hypothetical protein